MSRLRSSAPFGQRLVSAVEAHGPLCVGIDPHPALLRQWGLADDPAGLAKFAMTCVEAFAGQVAVLKPQSAFFERHGSAGIRVLEDVLADTRARGSLVLLDAKRGDIGSTMQGYADAYLEPDSPLATDAITVSPFLGFGSLRPVLDTAARHGAGVFVLALTSNPDGPQVQAARAGSRSVAGQILAHVRHENRDAQPLGSVGVVVGATVGTAGSWAGGEDLDVNGPILAPGLGAQGATVDDLGSLFGPLLPRVLPATSRAILRTGPDVDDLRAAATAVADALRAAAALRPTR